MSYQANIDNVARWIALVEARSQILGKTKAAETGEECTTSGDIQLDGEVAAFLLQPVQVRLPDYGYTSSDGQLTTGRIHRSATPAKVRPMPVLLFTLNWADSGPGLSWPESYYVTFVPQLDIRIVTASCDNDELWGCTDLAIGWCKPIGRADWGTKKIITAWWRRGCGELMPWQGVWAPGLIAQARAERWRREVFGARSRDDC